MNYSNIAWDILILKYHLLPTWDSDLMGYPVFYLATLCGQCLALLQSCSRTLGILNRIVRCVVNWEWDRLGCEAIYPVFRTLSLGQVPAGLSGFPPEVPHWAPGGWHSCSRQHLGPVDAEETCDLGLSYRMLTSHLMSRTASVTSSHPASIVFLFAVSFGLVSTWFIK